MNKKVIEVISREFDKTISKSWQVELIERKDSLLQLVGEFEREINHRHLGVIRRKTLSYEFYWLDRWYNVFRFHEPDGTLRNFYCNVNMPPIFENDVLDYIDLDLDILVRNDFSYKILDSEEFEENARKHSYSDEVRKNVQAALDELIRLIERRAFPFDYKF